MNLGLDFVFERLGTTRVVIARNYDCPIPDVLRSLSVEPNADALFEVSADRAADCLTALLWKDLAYSCEMMPEARAEAYAKQFIAQFPHDSTRFFTNGEWERYHEVTAFSYTPVTKATFSAVVMVVSPDYAVGVVIEDED